MPRCTVCSSSQRAAVESRIVAGDALASLADEYGLPPRELGGHKRECLGLGRPRRQRHKQEAGVLPW